MLMLAHVPRTAALAGMFRSFLKEAGHPVSSTAPAHAPAAPHGSPPSPGCCTKRRRNTELLLHVTLEDLYQGCVKQVAVQRQRTQGAMRTSHQVRGGWRRLGALGSSTWHSDKQHDRSGGGGRSRSRSIKGMS